MKKFVGLFFMIFGIVPWAYSQTSNIEERDAKANVLIEDGIDDNGDLVKVDAVDGQSKIKKAPEPEVSDSKNLSGYETARV